MNGSFVLADDSDGIASALNKALSSNLKDISVATNNSGVAELILTVDQFRGLPYYSNEQAIIIRDSETNIVRALNFGVLDDRVTTLDISSTDDSDGKLTVTVAEAEKLGHYNVKQENSSTTIVIEDRGSAIAFIEEEIASGATLSLRDLKSTNLSQLFSVISSFHSSQ